MSILFVLNAEPPASNRVRRELRSRGEHHIGSAGMLIRMETGPDHEAVRELNSRAFESESEARLVDALRSRAHPLVSLVAGDGSGVIGHILFSPVTVEGHESVKVMGLAPMSVQPDRQHQGVGSALIRAGLKSCAEIGVAAVVVLGHPGYYPRFGFVPASQYLIRCEYDVPDDVFLAQELVPGALDACHGLARYHEAFAEL